MSVSKPWFAGNLHWSDVVDWWETPALAYGAGLAHGAQAERDRQDAEAGAAAVLLSRAAVRAVEVVEARRGPS